MPTFHTSLAKSEASHQLFQIGESLFFHVWCHVSVVLFLARIPFASNILKYSLLFSPKFLKSIGYKFKIM